MTTLRLASLAAAACALASQASATAFQLREGSATSIGTALAGRTANDRDVSLAIQNPAVLKGVEGGEISSGLAFISATADATTDATLPGFTSSDDPNEVGLVPSLIAGYRITPKTVIGIAVDSPFGLATEYSKNFVGSFDGVRSELTTITVTPMASYSITPTLTLGAGVSFQYADAELQSRVAGGPNGVADVSGDGFDIGFTVGLLYEPLPGTKLGLNYQSGFEHTLDGEFSANFPGVGGRSGEARFDLPEVASFGVIQSITEDVRVMAEVEWTGWSAYDRVLITDKATGAVVQDDPQNYDDSLMFSFGAEYDWSDRLAVRAGVGFDETPTSDAFRTVRTPDSNRYWLSAGASYEITERVGLDVGYTLIIMDDTVVTLRNGPPQVRGQVVDYEDGMVHLLAANLRYAF
jgi:long-chain fatty acid transport protein